MVDGALVVMVQELDWLLLFMIPDPWQAPPERSPENR
jgi:hypothetical protein